MPTATSKKCPACRTALDVAKNGLTVCSHCDFPHQTCALCKASRGYTGTGPGKD